METCLPSGLAATAWAYPTLAGGCPNRASHSLVPPGTFLPGVGPAAAERASGVDVLGAGAASAPLAVVVAGTATMASAAHHAIQLSFMTPLPAGLTTRSCESLAAFAMTANPHRPEAWLTPQGLVGPCSGLPGIIRA